MNSVFNNISLKSSEKATIIIAAIGNGIVFIRDETELQNKSLLKKQDAMMDVINDAEWMKVENNLED